jgi:hypothetical protein
MTLLLLELRYEMMRTITVNTLSMIGLVQEVLIETLDMRDGDTRLLYKRKKTFAFP